MIDVEAIRRLNNYDTDSLVRVLELNEDRLHHWLVLGSVTVVRDDLDGSIEYVKALREMVRFERPDYVNPCEPVLPLLNKGNSGSRFSTCRTYGIFRGTLVRTSNFQ